MSASFAVLGQFGEAIDFIFNERPSPAGGTQVGGLGELWDLMWPHLKLSGASMAIAFSLLFILAGNTLVNILARYEWVKYLMFANVDLSQYVNGTPIRPEMTLTFSIGILVAYYALFHFITWIMFTKRDVAG